ncbi:TPA: hypothetical protein ACPP6G_001702 [Haemophilus influenzae]
MRIEFSDLIAANEMFYGGLYALSNMVRAIEKHADVEDGDLYGISDLIQLLAIAGQKQTNDLATILTMVDNEDKETE